MTNSHPVLLPIPPSLPSVDPLRGAVARYLSRFQGQTRVHTDSDLRVFLLWCAQRRLDPLQSSGRAWSRTSGGCRNSAASGLSTVSRRPCVVAGFYRTCVIDHFLESSPAECVRRPRVPAESPPRD